MSFLQYIKISYFYLIYNSYISAYELTSNSNYLMALTKNNCDLFKLTVTASFK